MKTLLFLLILIFINFNVFAQKISVDRVPRGVRKALHDKYPSLTKVTWEKEKGNYEANFKLKGKDNSVLINDAGMIIEEEVSVAVTALPPSIIKYISSHYKGKIKEAALITKPNGVVTYEAEVNGKDLIFSVSGELVEN